MAAPLVLGGGNLDDAIELLGQTMLAGVAAHSVVRALDAVRAAGGLRIIEMTACD